MLTKLLLPNLQATAKEYGVATVSVTSSAAMYESAYAGGVDTDSGRWSGNRPPPEAQLWACVQLKLGRTACQTPFGDKTL